MSLRLVVERARICLLGCARRMQDKDLSATMELLHHHHLLYHLMVRVEARLVLHAEAVRGESAAPSMGLVVIPRSAAVPGASRRTAYVLEIWV